MIYRAADKNNNRLDRRSMRRFRAFLEDMHVDELHMVGRLYTWSNEQPVPTMERLDRMFATVDWLEAFPNHCLKALSFEHSDHCPILLQSDCGFWPKRHFRFESFWLRLPGSLDVVGAVWPATLLHADPCRVLDYKLRNVARALMSWSAKQVGSIRLQLAGAREVVFRLDKAMESRTLTPDESSLRKSLKVRCLGLASLSRTIARQRSRLHFLNEGDTNTRSFHLQACHRQRKNQILSLVVDGLQVVHDGAMAESLFSYYNSILGTEFQRTRRINLQAVGVPTYDLSGLDVCFSEEEIWAVIRELPPDKAPGQDGFTGNFCKHAWLIIKLDVINAINAFWALDYRSFNLLNDAFLVLLKKKPMPTEIKDYRPISLMHSFGKLVAKCLAVRLSTKLDQLMLPNQSAFIKGRCIHDNFQSVQLACRAVHASKAPCVLLKIDIARAFDSVSWPFLLELL